jgi:uncharacterized protein involved in outer membrane biogenesis
VGALSRTGAVSKRRGWIIGTLGAIAVLLLGALILFDWNWLKRPIESQVSERLGRPFRIHGDLDVELSLQPKITVERAELGNAPWASDAPMAKIDRVEVAVDLLKLVQGEIVLPELRIAKPDLLLETRPDGPPNWQFGQAQEASPSPPALPRIGQLEVSDASIRYHDHGSGRNVAAEALAVLAAGGEEKEAGMVPVQCLVSRFEVQDGVMMTRALVLETSDSTVTGSGTIDLGQETLDITLLAHPKDASVLGERSYPVAGNLSKLALRKTLQIVQKALDISAVPDGLPDREVEGCAVGGG